MNLVTIFTFAICIIESQCQLFYNNEGSNATWINKNDINNGDSISWRSMAPHTSQSGGKMVAIDIDGKRLKIVDDDDPNDQQDFLGGIVFSESVMVKIVAASGVDVRGVQARYFIQTNDCIFVLSLTDSLYKYIGSCFDASKLRSSNLQNHRDESTLTVRLKRILNSFNPVLPIADFTFHDKHIFMKMRDDKSIIMVTLTNSTVHQKKLIADPGPGLIATVFESLKHMTAGEGHLYFRISLANRPGTINGPVLYRVDIDKLQRDGDIILLPTTGQEGIESYMLADKFESVSAISYWKYDTVAILARRRGASNGTVGIFMIDTTLKKMWSMCITGRERCFIDYQETALNKYSPLALSTTAARDRMLLPAIVDGTVLAGITLQFRPNLRLDARALTRVYSHLYINPARNFDNHYISHATVEVCVRRAGCTLEQWYTPPRGENYYKLNIPGEVVTSSEVTATVKVTFVGRYSRYESNVTVFPYTVEFLVARTLPGYSDWPLYKWENLFFGYDPFPDIVQVTTFQIKCEPSTRYTCPTNQAVINPSEGREGFKWDGPWRSNPVQLSAEISWFTLAGSRFQSTYLVNLTKLGYESDTTYNLSLVVNAAGHTKERLLGDITPRRLMESVTFNVTSPIDFTVTIKLDSKVPVSERSDKFYIELSDPDGAKEYFKRYCGLVLICTRTLTLRARSNFNFEDHKLYRARLVLIGNRTNSVWDRPEQYTYHTLSKGETLATEPAPDTSTVPVSTTTGSTLPPVIVTIFQDEEGELGFLILLGILLSLLVTALITAILYYKRRCCFKRRRRRKHKAKVQQEEQHVEGQLYSLERNVYSTTNEPIISIANVKAGYGYGIADFKEKKKTKKFRSAGAGVEDDLELQQWPATNEIAQPIDTQYINAYDEVSIPASREQSLQDKEDENRHLRMLDVVRLGPLTD